MEIKLIDYLPTPGQGQVGIATINFNNMIHLRFKVKNKKDSVGYYVIPASYKITRNGKDEFLNAFVIDSNFAKEKIESLIIEAVNLSELQF